MRGNQIVRVISALIFFGLLTGPVAALEPLEPLESGQVPKITVHELKKKLDKGEKVIVLDMRVGGDYTKSPIKIKGDVRMPLESVEWRVKELPMGYEIVTYCT